VFNLISKKDNMKKKYIIIPLCLVLVFLSSCEKLVEVDFPNNQTGSTQVFDDLTTANSALGYLYAALRDNSVLTEGNYTGAGALLGSYTDDLDCYFIDENGATDIYQNQLQETNSKIKTLWKNAYKQIYYANSIIYGVENSTVLPDDDKNRLKGEALAIRSLIYFYLQQLFGDIPYTTSLDYEYNRTISKTPAVTVLDRLKADVTEAVGLLDDDYRDAERIYINRKAAQLLLARIYLLSEEWSLAEQTADAVLQSPLYEFQTDINEVFHKSGSHILWQLIPEKAGNGTLEASFYYFTDAAPKSYTLSEDLLNVFSDDDLRKQSWMAEVTYNGNTWYRPYKYKNRSDNTNEYSVIFRLAEAYFIMAEALAEQDRIEEALPYLNATRERAGLTVFTSLSYEDFNDELLAERRREFFTEFGLRFIDLKRLDRLDDLSAVKPDWDGYMQVWPLPQNELLLNANLYPQNTGY
jgi:hypothetical protein